MYAPCALGGALNDDTVPALRAKVVAGAANNQLAHPGIEKLLADRGILYAPDYVVNAGGVIQVADEIEGFNFDRAKLRATRIYDTTRQILQLADAEGVPPAVAADRLAERRMADVGRLRAIHLRVSLPGADRRDPPPPRPDVRWYADAGLIRPFVRCHGCYPVRSLPGTLGDGRIDATRRAGLTVTRGAERWHPDMYRKSHERCLTSSGPAFGLPRILCEGVEPWGAAVLRPSRRRWPGS